ncbi:MAG: hypothetical protein IPN33_06945 [Saprospiraceae bacterium]|nr:hypothetical protein [Saprospiraceae bacterium]
MLNFHTQNLDVLPLNAVQWLCSLLSGTPSSSNSFSVPIWILSSIISAISPRWWGWSDGLSEHFPGHATRSAAPNCAPVTGLGRPVKDHPMKQAKNCAVAAALAQ